MTSELRTAIDTLYVCFSKYPLNAQMEGCPCCVSGEDKSTLHSKSLRDLTGDDLSKYAFKAMTTWGTVDDFKHYLPRIFELMTTGFIVDTFVVLGKLEYSEWQTWPTEEQAAIRQFLLAWWSHIVQLDEPYDAEVFLEIHQRLGNLEAMLAPWTAAVGKGQVRFLVDFISTHLHFLSAGKKMFRKLSKGDNQMLLQWVHGQKEGLEKAFFRHANDPAYAADISNALYILERSI